MSKRLGGKIKIPDDRVRMDTRQVYHLPTKGSIELGRRKGRQGRMTDAQLSEIIHADEWQMSPLLDRAERLIDEAIVLDPRLTKRAAWRLAEDGIDACPAMLSQGEERCYLDRRKLRMSEEATVEPVRIVISTDTKDMKADHAIAFIAAAKLAQQFRPLEIWWQGAWLIEGNANDRGPEGSGHIIHVPLIQGDMDFSRLVFILSNQNRDHVSFRIMLSYAYPAGYGWGGGVGKYSYLDDTFDYVSEKGICCDAYNVARYAARWAGMEPRWTTEIGDSSAEQRWVEPTAYKPWVPSDDDKARWTREEKERNELALK